ncbi:MAG TPA: phage holin family protein [Steroidobacteraceae bacterium]|nr:phage holin family protein [Steroidobacteraceae bacterium]
MTGFLIRGALVALGLWLSSQIFKGLSFDDVGTLIAAALLLGIVNAVVRPLVLILTLPITLLTLGFFLLVINAGMLGLVALVLEGFHLSSFWTALGTSLVVSLTAWIGSTAVGNNGKIEFYSSRRRED